MVKSLLRIIIKGIKEDSGEEEFVAIDIENRKIGYKFGLKKEQHTIGKDKTIRSGRKLTYQILGVIDPKLAEFMSEYYKIESKKEKAIEKQQWEIAASYRDKRKKLEGEIISYILQE
ncbi:MAG: hypothetical protein AABW50_03475 [Nanoarchaeota archaeon]